MKTIVCRTILGRDISLYLLLSPSWVPSPKKAPKVFGSSFKTNSPITKLQQSGNGKNRQMSVVEQYLAGFIPAGFPCQEGAVA